ncbi:hypothetical protein D5086_032385 [Populus alba]|uniref:Uncharacterized protein n=1 Tax=Populus alba TaxID=43335 RepID=A0ACC4ALB3_POPAL
MAKIEMSLWSSGDEGIEISKKQRKKGKKEKLLNGPESRDVRNRELRRKGEKEVLLEQVTYGGDEVVSRCLIVDGYVGVSSGGEAS